MARINRVRIPDHQGGRYLPCRSANASDSRDLQDRDFPEIPAAGGKLSAGSIPSDSESWEGYASCPIRFGSHFRRPGGLDQRSRIVMSVGSRLEGSSGDSGVGFSCEARIIRTRRTMPWGLRVAWTCFSWVDDIHYNITRPPLRSASVVASPAGSAMRWKGILSWGYGIRVSYGPILSMDHEFSSTVIAENIPGTVDSFLLCIGQRTDPFRARFDNGPTVWARYNMAFVSRHDV